MKSSHKVLWLLFGVFALAAAFIYSANKSVSAMTGLLDGSLLGSSSNEYPLSKANVAILPFDGVILGSKEWLDLIQQARDQENIEAVVVRINSPGGAVAPSQEIYESVARLRQKKKVYCSLEDVAASGGYYIAAACEKIFANPGTITGSIGVIMSFVNLQALFAWAKIDPLTLKAGKFKDVGSQNRPMRDEERALLQGMLDEVHKQFKDAIKQGRPALEEAIVEEYADGRILTGAQAKDLGFVDHLGGLEVTLDHVKEELKLSEVRPSWVRPSRRSLPFWLEQKLDKSTNVEVLGKSFTDAVGRWIPQLNSNLEAGKPYLLPYHWFEGDGMKSK